MQNIVIPSRSLNHRGAKVQKLLRHISFDSQNGPAYSNIPYHRGHLIGFYGGQFRPGDHPRDWRFKTIAPSIYAMYFEQWIPSETGKHSSWYLDRAYLNLYELSDQRFMDSEKEFVCLHCDPNETDVDAHSDYKRVPHIHIKAAQEPIPQAHISLNLDFSDKVLNSVETLFSSLETAIVMLRDEILDRMLQ